MHNVMQMSERSRSKFLGFKERYADKLAGRCQPRDADIFWLRFERYLDDIYEPLARLYGDRSDVDAQVEALFAVMVEAYASRPEELRLLDLERQFTSDWFERSNMVGYVCYPDLFAGTLEGVRNKVGYLEELGVTYLHLMPLLHPRPAPNDGGYAVQDYRAVKPELGTMDDLRALSGGLRDRGISLCIDLVVNHTAKEHEWAQKAIAGDPDYLDYYYTFPDRAAPDEYEKTLPEVFPDDAPGNFTWCPEMDGTGRWVWTTFMDYQWDLNYTNPAVFREMLEVMYFLVNQGVDVLRLDAAPFVWKEMGTDCRNRPEVFDLIQAFRGLMRIVAPGVIFKAEAIVPPDQLQQYIGVKTTTGRQCELAYNNQLMVLLWSALATRKATLLSHVLQKRAPPLLLDSSVVAYVRNHDDIGWAMSDEDLVDIGEDPTMHRRFLNAFFTGEFDSSFSRGERFQFNPVTGDARLSGTTASLAGLETALESGDEQAIDLAIRRILLLHSAITFGTGIPLVYMGDEIGLLNDYAYREDPIKATDSRWLHRPTMDWEKAEKRNDPSTAEGRIHRGLKQLLWARKSCPLLHSFAVIVPTWTDNEHVWAVCRKRPEGSVLFLANFAEDWQSVDAAVIPNTDLPWDARDLLAPDTNLNVSEGRLYLAPYQSLVLIGDA